MPDIRTLKRRGIYYLEARPESEGGLYIWVRHRPANERRKRKFGRKLAPYFERQGWKIPRHLNDAPIRVTLITDTNSAIGTTNI